MTKVQKAAKPANANLWPLETDAIYQIKVDKETQKFYIDDQDLDYGEFDEFTFRTLEVYSKLKAYNYDFSKTDIESTFFAFSGDSRDSRGTHVVKDGKTVECCGRIIPTELTKKMSDDEKKANKDKAKWYTYVFGIAYIPGKNPVLCDFQLPGGKQIEVNNILKKIKDEKKDYHKAELRFKAFESTDFDWPDIEVTGDFSRDLPVTGLEPFLDTIKTYVDDHNDKIDVKAEKWKKYGGKPYKPNKGSFASPKKTTKPLPVDSDDIPF